jgi:hypothetical protein
VAAKAILSITDQYMRRILTYYFITGVVVYAVLLFMDGSTVGHGGTDEHPKISKKNCIYIIFIVHALLWTSFSMSNLHNFFK